MSKILILIPTEVERRWASSLVEKLSEELSETVTVELCGFGPVIAGIRATQLIAQHRPQRVLLVGIAGAIASGLKIGEAYEFEQVACYGIGIGCGPNFQTVSEMGWSHWASDNLGVEIKSINDTIQLLPADNSSSRESARLLLTVCAASTNAADVSRHQEKFPQAMAEDMEGFSVAAACKLSRVPLRIVRGISNMAGDREHQNWQSAAAMHSALQLAMAILVE
ncbi:MAG: futalosine hydrolase [Aureliella sp.]